MQCPHCQTFLDHDAEFCKVCDLSMPILDGILLGEDKNRVELQTGINDFCKVLNFWQRRVISAMLEKFENCFPQTKLIIYIDSLESGFNFSIYNFWLFNKHVFNIHSQSENPWHCFDTLISLDVNNKVANIIVGYQLEAFLEEEDLREVLQHAQNPLRKSQYFKALLNIIKAYADLLQRSKKRSDKIYGEDGLLATPQKKDKSKKSLASMLEA